MPVKTENLFIVPSHIRLDKIEQQLAPELFRETFLKKAIDNLDECRQNDKYPRQFLVEIAKQEPLDDAGILGVIAREVRQRQESIESFKQGNRPDLVVKEEAEMAVLQVYLPQEIAPEGFYR